MANRETLIDNEIPNTLSVGQIDPKVYNDIARCAKLLSVQMIESSFDISPQFFAADIDGKPGIDFTDLHSSFDSESRVATSVFLFDSYVKKGRKRVFSCKSRFVAYYRIAVECDETHASAFARKTGMMACYPYFRSFVATTASMANADIPILPIISAMPVREKIKEAE